MFKNGLNAWRSLIGPDSVSLPRATAGVSLIAMSVLALAAPLATGKWSLQLMALLPFLVGLTELYSAIRSPTCAAVLIVCDELPGHRGSHAAVSECSPRDRGRRRAAAWVLRDRRRIGAGQAVLGRDTPSSRVATAVNGTSSLLLGRSAVR